MQKPSEVGGEGQSEGQLGSSVYLIAPHVGPFRFPKGGRKKKKKKIERKGIIIEMYRLSMFQGKTANLLRRHEGDIFIFRKKGEKKNSNGPFQAEDSFVAWNF